MANIRLEIAGRSYEVACRDGEEENLRSAAKLVDAKSREALAGLGALSESRQLLFASLLIADQMLEKPGSAAASAEPDLAPRVEAFADRLEKLADTLEASQRDA
ncbi:MAG: cell division protein ZapA [Sphingomicrobium sp.]